MVSVRNLDTIYLCLTTYAKIMIQNLLSRILHRRRFNLLLGVLSLGMALTFSACAPNSTGTISSPSSSADPAQIRIGYQVVPNAELLVKATGTAEKAFPNSKVIWKSFESGREVNAAMANDLDLGSIGSTATSIGIANQLPYQVYFIHSVIGDNEALVVKGNIKSLADLRGKKVGVPFGSTTHFSLLSALQQQGISPTEVTILDMKPPTMLAAWQGGDIDAGFIWQPTLNKMVDAKGSVLLSAKDLYKKGIITADLGVAHKDFITQHPATLQKYVALLDEAVNFYREQPEAAAAAIAPEVGLSPAETLQVMNQLIWLSSSEQANGKHLGSAKKPGAFASVLKDSADFMEDQGAIQEVPDLGVFRAGIYTGGLAK
jgi:taurine transport system substrate-binding protein